jgi:hypothetical protein
MTRGTLIDALSDRPADPKCACEGKGYYYPEDAEFARTCECRFSASAATPGTSAAAARTAS